MNKKINLILSVTITFLLVNHIGNGQETVKINAFNFPCQRNTSDYARIGIKLFNGSGNPMKIPSFRQVGIKNDPFADLIIELRKCIEDSAYVPVDLSDEYLPPTEYAAIIELPSNGIISDTINYALYYRFTIGKYQGRVMYKAWKYNSGMESVYSNWVEFVVSEVIPLKTYKPRTQ